MKIVGNVSVAAFTPLSPIFRFFKKVGNYVREIEGGVVLELRIFSSSFECVSMVVSKDWRLLIVCGVFITYENVCEAMEHTNSE